MNFITLTLILLSVMNNNNTEIGFRVHRKMCKTCIYLPNSPLDLPKLEEECKDKYGFFDRHRECHHAKQVCCRGFWNAHKDEFTAGQISQRLNMVVEVDVLEDDSDD